MLSEDSLVIWLPVTFKDLFRRNVYMGKDKNVSNRLVLSWSGSPEPVDSPLEILGSSLIMILVQAQDSDP